MSHLKDPPRLPEREICAAARVENCRPHPAVARHAFENRRDDGRKRNFTARHCATGVNPLFNVE